jgi:ABC-type branched-subunit amino acid transport system ATPase component/ABC-type branched-subunit amino acid transport system permease subunit
VNIGTLVLGLLNGLTIGLLAVGFVLVYKANRFLNLAHAQLGTLSALLLAKLVLDAGLSFWLVFPLVIGVGIGIGLLVERLLVAPLRARTSSPITLLLLSLGISQLLLAVTYIPSLGPDLSEAPQYPQPFESDLMIGAVRLTGMSVLTAVLVPLLVIALAVFFRYSILGKQIRAAASNPDAARLAGIPVRRVSAITWAIAGALSAITAVLQAPTQGNFNVAALGPYLLLLTLGAAAFGAFVSMPMALAGGLLLGVVAQVVAAETSSGANAQVAVFVLTLAIVLFRGKAIGRVFSLAGSVVQERPVLRVPESLSNSPLVRFQYLWLGTITVLFAAVWPLLPYFDTVGRQFLLSLVLINALLGVALTMLLGWGGQVSLGHFAVVGVTSYLTVKWAPEGWSLPALCLFAAVVGALVMVLVGLPALRVRGLTLAVTTLGFGVITSEWLLRQGWLGGESSFGVSLDTLPPLAPGLGTPSTPLHYYYISLVVLVLAVAGAAALRRSMPGRLVVAVRDNEKASAAFGISPATIKLSILAVSGSYAGIAGVLFVGSWRSVSPGQFTADVSLALIAIPVIGGLGSLGGAVLAAVLLYAGTFFLGPLVSPLFGDFGNNLGFALFLAGAGTVFAILKLPQGLAGEVQQRWQLYLERRAARAEPGPGALGAAGGADGEGDEAPLPLQVTGVTVRFGGITALDSPDISVRAGEIVGLIGTNGAGKSTLLNVISGVIPPEKGSVRVFGSELVDLPADFRPAYGVSRSFQDASLFGGLTVLETVQLAIARRHKVGFLAAMVAAPWVRASERRTRREAEEIVERFGLASWRDSRTSDLSTGTRRITDLAAQVASRPKLLLLDEPTAGVAQREAEAFGPLLRRIRDELDCSILIVEHDMPLLMGLCDRVYALETGQVIAEGTPEEMRADPRVVASYLGTDETAISRSGKVVPKQPRMPAGERVSAAKAAAAEDGSADEDVAVLATAGRTAGGEPSTRRSTRRAR